MASFYNTAIGEKMRGLNGVFLNASSIHPRIARLACLLLLLAASPVWAGLFQVKSVDSELQDGVYHVHAHFDLRFSRAMKTALENGVTLILAVEIAVEQPHRYWLDEDVARLEQRYSVSFHPLTRQYLVTDLNTEVQKNFHSLRAAIEYLNNSAAVPTIDAKRLDPDGHYVGYIRVSLVRGSLPLALKVKAYYKREWRAASDWLRWRIQ